MRHLIAKHKDVEFKAGDLVKFYVKRTDSEAEGMIAAIDDGALAESELELFVVSQKDVFGDCCPVEIDEWEGEERELLFKYHGWYWDWVDISACELVDSSMLKQIIKELEREVK